MKIKIGYQKSYVRRPQYYLCCFTLIIFVYIVKDSNIIIIIIIINIKHYLLPANSLVLLLFIVGLDGLQQPADFFDSLDLEVGIGLQVGQFRDSESFANAGQHFHGIFIGGVVTAVDDFQVLGPVGIELFFQDHFGALT